MKLLPITVTVLPKYAKAGHTDPYVAPLTTVSSALEVSAVAPDPPPLNTTLTITEPIGVPSLIQIVILDVESSSHVAAIESMVAEQLVSEAGRGKSDPAIRTVDPI